MTCNGQVALEMLIFLYSALFEDLRCLKWASSAWRLDSWEVSAGALLSTERHISFMEISSKCSKRWKHYYTAIQLSHLTIQRQKRHRFENSGPKQCRGRRRGETFEAQPLTCRKVENIASAVQLSFVSGRQRTRWKKECLTNLLIESSTDDCYDYRRQSVPHALGAFSIR